MINAIADFLTTQDIDAVILTQHIIRIYKQNPYTCIDLVLDKTAATFIRSENISIDLNNPNSIQQLTNVLKEKGYQK